MTGPGRPARRAACPVCGEAADTAFRPFCSRRCADVDLGRWLTERYVIPDTDEDERPPPEPDPDA